jgi:hypothetical protein
MFKNVPVLIERRQSRTDFSDLLDRLAISGKSETVNRLTGPGTRIIILFKIKPALERDHSCRFS